MKLPPPSSLYAANQEAQRNRLLEQADNQNYKKRQDVIVHPPARLITGNIDFLTDQPVDITTGQMSWNATDATVDLALEYGVRLQLGQEQYARVQNNTGVTIPNGAVVGAVGVGPTNALSVAPYLANGTQTSLAILGVMTHELPDTGEKGYCTVWGHVRQLNTSAFAAGDLLYASPTTAGALTKVKPTAPNNVIPIAVVLKVGTTDGEIFVRPTIEQQQNYGVFSDTTTQIAAAAYTPQAITFNTTDFSKGVSRGSPTSRIVAAASGLYNFQFSSQVISNSSSVKKLWIWPRVNGVDVVNSNSELTISSNSEVMVPAWNWVLSLNADDYFQIMFAVDDTNVQLPAIAAQTGSVGTATFARPATPSIILTVTQVQQ